ncbi:Protein ybjI [Pediococcus damnosus]|uniref:Protein ybjI n=1 Tax=Pediococcus damnosus TaxID=51663 RepID=A0A0R2HKJ5_9LACO|nr:Cof-type HAD-IIB family hydrolase [Pediococcus damnosus]AMV60798.1 Protein ybjI [Pediococcus damnosus]AMV63385.1 Protein ybjI [Pediococcus damnosus]AMV65108.1 Protein ybjI [Pediococcus damnosus]AMV66709.1 Protein ybjI [Pediococcus damnosus]AMV69922.1 Protein ybjI [Pediococcus damnosus]
MSIKLIASDIDGTFLDDQHEFDRTRFQNQLDEMNRRGIHFVVASGNQYLHCTKVMTGINGDLTYVAEDGALIVEKGKMLDSSPIEPELWQKVVTSVDEQPILANAVIILSGEKAAHTNVTPQNEVWGRTGYFYENLTHASDFSTVTDEIYKVDVNWPDLADIRDKYNVLTTEFGNQLTEVMSGYSGIDIIKPHVTKAYGLVQLQRIWNVSMAETMTFGDNQNDAEMLKHAKYGYAMKNASPEAKAATSLVTPLDNNHSGVLDMIDRVLNDQI